MAMPSPGSSASTAPELPLHDIHIPEQISNFPIAPGWWILLALIVISALVVYKKLKARKQLNAIKKHALTVLNDNQAMTAKECISLLKWAAMHYFSRQKIAKLYGASFQLFLMQQLPEKYQDSFKNLSDAGFTIQYQAQSSQEQASLTLHQHQQINQPPSLDTISEQEASQGSLVKTQPVSGTHATDSDCQQATKLWLTHALPAKKAKNLPVINETLEDKPVEEQKSLKEAEYITEQVTSEDTVENSKGESK